MYNKVLTSIYLINSQQIFVFTVDAVDSLESRHNPSCVFSYLN